MHLRKNGEKNSEILEKLSSVRFSAQLVLGTFGEHYI